MPATITVYIPIELESENEITQAQACRVGSSISAMIADGFYCNYNVWDTATACGVDLADIKTKPAITNLNHEETNNA